MLLRTVTAPPGEREKNKQREKSSLVVKVWEFLPGILSECWHT